MLLLTGVIAAPAPRRYARPQLQAPLRCTRAALVRTWPCAAPPAAPCVWRAASRTMPSRRHGAGGWMGQQQRRTAETTT